MVGSKKPFIRRELMTIPFPTTRRVFIATCAILSLGASVYAGPKDISNDSRIESEINNVLNLESSWHTTLQIHDVPNRPITVAIPIENVTYTLELEPHSVRSDIYSVFMSDDDGELYEVAPGPIRTLRGTITELAGSRVAGSLMTDGLYVRINLADGNEYWMEPVGAKLRNAPSDLYAFYRGDDIIASGGVCGANEKMQVGSVLSMLAHYHESEHENRVGGLQVAQLGCDTDYEYWQDWGSNTESRINQVINAVNQQYESQVELLHEITTVIVRDNSNDPYTSSDAGTLLNQFRNEWNSNQGGIQRDVAHLFTGKNTGSTIGIAWLGVVCYTSQAYSLVQSDCCGSFGCTTDLSAHELGHNWNADHQESPSYNTMYPSIQCANYFIEASIYEISSYANSVSCLSNGAPQGACCIVGNQCIDTYESTCDAGGGTFQGAGTTCATADCSDPHGACCIDGVCSDQEELACTNAGGDYAGDGSDCATTGCSLGACCVGIDCSLTLLSDCGGSWFGDNTNCADITCGAGTDQLNYELRTWSRSDGQEMETYDLFFPSSDPNTKMVAVFGENADVLDLRSWTNADFDGSATPVALHQSVYGDDVPHDRILDPILGIELAFDSFVTIGGDDSADGEVLLLGFDSVGFNSDAGLSMDNGLWFVIPDNPMASMGAGTALGHRLGSYSVEAGQGIETLVNVQWFDGAEIVHEARNIYWNNLGLGGGGSDCPTDVDGSGATDVGDVLELISQWGPCPGCSGDLNGDGVVNVTDLLEVIGAWGPCSEPETFNVTANASTFTPSSLDVRRGDTIIWTRTGGNHTVTSGDDCIADGLFDAPLDNSDPVFTWVVPSDAPASIPYFCEPHCSFGMVGDINVID